MLTDFWDAKGLVVEHYQESGVGIKQNSINVSLIFLIIFTLHFMFPY